MRTGRPASARLLGLHWLHTALLASLADARVTSVALCAKCHLAGIITLMTETAHGTEFCSDNQTLLNGPLPRKLRRFESARDGLPHAASHRHLVQGARELMAEQVSLHFLGFADPRVAPLSSFVPGGSAPALECRWVATGAVDWMPRHRVSREQPSPHFRDTHQLGGSVGECAAGEDRPPATACVAGAVSDVRHSP
jgi:hypothetical protein